MFKIKKLLVGSIGIIVSSIVFSLELYFLKVFEIIENKYLLVQKNACNYIKSPPILWAIIVVIFAIVFSFFLFIWGLKEINIIKMKPPKFKQKIG